VTQIVLDDQLFEPEVLVPIARWTTVCRLRDLFPEEIIKDERVPVLLRRLRQPTFITIDLGFWDRAMRHSGYCLICFPLRNDEQHRLPDLLRRALRLPSFRTRASRMGKVVRISKESIACWELGNDQLVRIAWS